jgi:hypothetical protein
MARSGPLLTEVQWKKIAPLLPKPRKHRKGGRRGSRTVACWMAFCGFCGAGPAGRTCPRSIRIPRPAGGGCGTGRSGDPRRAASSPRPSSAETDAGDRRQSLRQRSVARAAGTTRNRIDRAASLQPQEPGDARWPSTAAVPASLDRRTHQRLARKLPPLGGALRPLAHDLSRVLSYRLLHDRLTEGCAIASSLAGRAEGVPLLILMGKKLARTPK